MPTVDYDKLEKSLGHLARQNQNRLTLAPHFPPIIREAVDESVIQRFETCYDTLWKVLRRHMHLVLGLPDLPNSPKPIFRHAHENGLLPSPLERWLGYADARISTSHDYSVQKAQQCLALVEGFVGDATHLFENLSGKKPGSDE